MKANTDRQAAAVAVPDVARAVHMTSKSSQ